MMKTLRFYFDRAADTYERASTVQKKVAKRLIEMVSSDYYRTVIEIGSGEGFLTESLIDKIKFDRYINLDISLRLLLKLRKKLGKRVSYINGKAENIPIRAYSTDLLISSSSLHWVDDIESSLISILKLLKEGGRFYFSIFVLPTLREIEVASKYSGFGSIYPLRTATDYLKILETNRNFKFDYEVVTLREKFTSVKEILYSLKLTGTNFTLNKRFSGKNSFKRFCDFYERTFKEGSSLYCTYEVLFIEGQRVSLCPQD